MGMVSLERAGSRDFLAFLLSLLNFGPRIPQGDRPIENEFLIACIRIQAEISLSLELISTERGGRGKSPFHLTARQALERIRVQIRGVVQALADIACVGLQKEVLVQSDLGLQGVRGRNPM